MVTSINPALLKELYREIKTEFQQVERHLSAEGLKRYAALFGENFNIEDRKEIKRIFSEMGITISYLDRTLYDKFSDGYFCPLPGFFVGYFSYNIDIDELLNKVKLN